MTHYTFLDYPIVAPAGIVRAAVLRVLRARRTDRKLHAIIEFTYDIICVDFQQMVITYEY